MGSAAVAHTMRQPVPQDPDFSARVHDSFDRQALMQTIGARLARVDAGAVDIELDWSDSNCLWSFAGGFIDGLLSHAHSNQEKP